MSHPFATPARLLLVACALFAARASEDARADPAPDPSATALHVTSMRLLTPTTGWAASSTALFRTDDAGEHWLEITPALRDHPVIEKVFFLDTREGWAVVDAVPAVHAPSLAHTRDGGTSWTYEALPVSSARDGAAIALEFVDSDTGWLLLRTPTSSNFQRGSLLATRDGGRSWTWLPAPPVAERMSFVSAHVGWLAGGPEHDQVYATRDGGASWQRDRAEAFPDPRDRMAPISIDDARASGKLPAGAAITARDFKSPSEGWLLAAYGECDAPKSRCRQASRLYATTDGGLGLRDVTPRVAATSALAEPDSIFVSHDKKGFDQCAAGTIAQMQSWWTNTPWSDVNIYIGGSNRGCSQSQLTPAWVQAIIAQGWHLIPTWVGPQAPGSGCSSCGKMSSTPATARQQGAHEADLALAAAQALGLEEPTVLYYDMEGYSPTSDAAVAAFVDGWTARLHELGSTAGVYGGAGNASADWATVANPPDAVWIASWNGQASVFGISGLSDTLWPNHQRIHQYLGGHDETWGGVTFNIDSDYEDGPVAGVDGLFGDGFE